METLLLVLYLLSSIINIFLPDESKKQIKDYSVEEEYIQAYCYLRREERTFRFDRILQVKKIV